MAKNKRFTGHKHTPEPIAKISAASRGRKLAPRSPEHRANLSAALRGRKFSPEHRAKISAANLGRTFSPEHRAKISAALLGHKHTEEAKAKMRRPRSNGPPGSHAGKKNSNWKGGIAIQEGYVLLKRPDHPFANCGGYVRRCRLVMEAHLDRFLLPEEVVHHEGKRDDDRIEKLMLFPNSAEHIAYHWNRK